MDGSWPTSALVNRTQTVLSNGVSAETSSMALHLSLQNLGLSQPIGGL